MIKQFTNSIADLDSYKYFIRGSIGKAVSYLVLVSLIFGSISMIRPIIDFSGAVDTITDETRSKIPNFVFENGKLRVYGKQPVIIDSGSGPVIIDTTGASSKKILDDYNNALLITDTSIIHKENKNYETTDLKMFQNFTLTSENIIGLIPLLKWLSIIVLTFGTVFFIIAQLIASLIVSIIGLILNGTVNTNLSYGNIYKLSCYALTVPVIIKALIDITGYDLPYFGIIFYGLASFYLWSGFKSVKTEKIETLHENP